MEQLTSFFSLDQLPLPGIDDMTMHVQAKHSQWVWQLKIVRGLKELENKTHLGPFLRQSLDNLDFLCGLALAQLEARLGASTSWEPASAAGAIMEVTNAFIEEVPKARAAWNEWLGASGRPLTGPNNAGKRKPDAAPNAETPSPALGCYGGMGAADPESTASSVTEQLQTLTEPKPTSSYWVKLGAVAALGFLAYVLR